MQVVEGETINYEHTQQAMCKEHKWVLEFPGRKCTPIKCKKAPGGIENTKDVNESWTTAKENDEKTLQCDDGYESDEDDSVKFVCIKTGNGWEWENATKGASCKQITTSTSTSTKTSITESRCTKPDEGKHSNLVLQEGDSYDQPVGNKIVLECKEYFEAKWTTDTPSKTFEYECKQNEHSGEAEWVPNGDTEDGTCEQIEFKCKHKEVVCTGGGLLLEESKKEDDLKKDSTDEEIKGACCREPQCPAPEVPYQQFHNSYCDNRSWCIGPFCCENTDPQKEELLWVCPTVRPVKCEFSRKEEKLQVCRFTERECTKLPDGKVIFNENTLCDTSAAPPRVLTTQYAT